MPGCLHSDLHKLELNLLVLKFFADMTRLAWLMRGHSWALRETCEIEDEIIDRKIFKEQQKH